MSLVYWCTLIHIDDEGQTMRTNVELDDALVEEAFRLTSARTKRELLHQALEALIRVHPSFASLPSSPNPFSQNGRRGAGVKVPLPLWERDLG